MDGDTFLDRLRANHDTELSRLGSSKALYALTGGEMEPRAVRTAAARDAAAAAETLAAWADDSEGEAAETFADAAATAADQRDAVAPDDASLGEPRPLYETLAGFDATPERVGGLVARHVVVEAYAGQFVGFFVGNADPTAASAFRDLRDAVEADRDAAVDCLAAVCETDDDWDRASEAAEAVVAAAYDDYVATLEGMGVKPKNVC